MTRVCDNLAPSSVRLFCRIATGTISQKQLCLSNKGHMEGFDGFDLEVDSVADLRPWVPVCDKSSVEEGVDGWHVVRS